MKLTKFETKRQEMMRKHQDELDALVEAERKERQKMIEPVIDKITKVAGEEVRKILEKNPEILESYTFKKREAGKALSTAIQALFDEGSTEEEDKAEPKSKSDKATGEPVSPSTSSSSNAEVFGDKGSDVTEDDFSGITDGSGDAGSDRDRSDDS
jgi:hypothetical protein